ncbi:MAG TPA: alkaline phosphatase family protein [Chloroflexota bacterium]|nr:alkaline phosphatase family protein [Chloroflexota bacterium]
MSGAELSDLDRLYRQGRISRRQFVLGLAALGLTPGTIAALAGGEPVQAAEPIRPEYLVVITLDACRPDYLQLADMPVLNSLIKSGTSYDRAWVGQLESETPTGHVSLSTGATPRHTGVIGFEWRNPRTGKEALDGWPKWVRAGDLERDLKASNANSIPRAVKAAEPHAKIVTVSSEKVHAADGMGGPWADYILFHERVGSGRNTLLPRGMPGHTPHPDFFRPASLHSHLPLTSFGQWDALSDTMALHALTQFRPKVLMVNLPGIDVYGHAAGGPVNEFVMRQVVEGADRSLGRIMDAYRRAGIVEKTLVVVVGDHGMVSNTHTVAKETVQRAVTAAGGRYFFHTGGTAADIYLHNPWHARAVAEQVARIPHVAGAYYLARHGNTREYVRVPGATMDPEIERSYHYLLSTYLGPTSPDVVGVYRENTIGEAYDVARGDHGGLNWGAQHVPLVLSGPGIASGVVSHFPARLIDVAPTVLRRLGIKPSRMDGVVLADALTDATAAEVAAQTALAAPLTAIQDGIMAAAEADIAADQKAHAHPPVLPYTRP